MSIRTILTLDSYDLANLNQLSHRRPGLSQASVLNEAVMLTYVMLKDHNFNYLAEVRDTDHGFCGQVTLTRVRGQIHDRDGRAQKTNAKTAFSTDVMDMINQLKPLLRAETDTDVVKMSLQSAKEICDLLDRAGRDSFVLKMDAAARSFTLSHPMLDTSIEAELQRERTRNRILFAQLNAKKKPATPKGPR